MTHSPKPLSVAFSPCPNDTFIFCAWVHGWVGKDLPIVPHLADVEVLNRGTCEGHFDVSKISIANLPAVTAAYQLLPAGGALGHGAGPKLIAKQPFPIADLPQKRLAIPGLHTTAFQLARSLLPSPKELIVCSYDQIVREIEEGRADCGLIIHETRFTFMETMVEIADLGLLWEANHDLPLPLGGIVVKRGLEQDLKEKILETIQASLQYAWQHPEAVHDYVLTHSQEKSPEIIKQHISLYVNAESFLLSPKGKLSIETLTGMHNAII
jgi:1,4-dihydroxy-6-naphthoate synthase